MPYTVPMAGFFEPLSSWLHLGGAMLAVLAARQLWQMGSTTATRFALAVFAGSAVFALTMSGVYHAIAPSGAAREVMQRLDHAAIWILIGGTFTPVHAIMFHGLRRWGMLAFIWACVTAGVVLKTIFFASVPPAVGLWLYLGLGWVGAISASMLTRTCGRGPVRPLLLGGILYSVGGAASILEAPTLLPGYIGPHELFHLAVVAALVVHWRFIASLPALAIRPPSPAAAPIAVPVIATR